LTNQVSRLTVAFFAATCLGPANAWDPWGDIQNPGRIIENTKREGGNAVKTVGDAIQKAAPVVATISCPGCSILVNALPKDQQQLVNTIVQKGLVISTLGTVGGLYYLTVLDAKNGDVHKDDVPVQIVDVPPTINRYSYNFNATACMTQLSNGAVQVYSKTAPDFWTKVKAGDIITVKADACPEYNSLQGVKNITSITMKITGASTNQLTNDGEGFRYLIVGNPAA
jgi:hypothetical protein